MDNDYRILIHTDPNYYDSPKAPYFWCILERGRVNSGSGWSTTPEKAFNDAFGYLQNIPH